MSENSEIDEEIKEKKEFEIEELCISIGDYSE
jgi:hypothetical protein